MKLFGNTNNPNETPRQKLTRQYASGRSTLLSLVIFSAINMVLLLLNSETYFLFSATVPYYLTAFCMSLDDLMGGAFFTVGAVVISLIILGVYLLCWGLSKKHPGWLVAAFIFLIMDSLALVVVSLLIPDLLLSSILDLVFHILILVSVGMAVSANGKIKTLPPEQPAFYDTYQPYSPTYNGNPEF